jgi:hypothetical protein
MRTMPVVNSVYRKVFKVLGSEGRNEEKYRDSGQVHLGYSGLKYLKISGIDLPMLIWFLKGVFGESSENMFLKSSRHVIQLCGSSYIGWNQYVFDHAEKSQFNEHFEDLPSKIEWTRAKAHELYNAANSCAQYSDLLDGYSCVPLPSGSFFQINVSLLHRHGAILVIFQPAFS